MILKCPETPGEGHGKTGMGQFDRAPKKTIDRSQWGASLLTDGKKVMSRKRLLQSPVPLGRGRLERPCK